VFFVLINCFDGEFAFLSNFYESSFEDPETGITFPTMEHFFQAMKADNMQDRLAIAAAPTPGKAKRLGRQCALRGDWEKVKEQVMEDGLRLKFADPELRKMLISTHPHELVEGTTWHDNEWGNCSCEQCKNILGKNKLGKILMKLRAEFMEEK
jgi:ribA/ribD-fused uncharacterized protein